MQISKENSKFKFSFLLRFKDYAYVHIQLNSVLISEFHASVFMRLHWYEGIIATSYLRIGMYLSVR